MRRYLLLVVLWTAAVTAAEFPGTEWTAAKTPESAGYSGKRLKALAPFLETLDTSAMMVISKGQVVYQYGDVSKISYLASCRKSVLAMLYGNYVSSGKIKLDRTLRDLNFDDIGGLLPSELDATVEDLISARSGVYHPASNAGDDTAYAPPRGSQKHGAYYLYNNWDFNAAGAAFEKMTGRDLFDAMESDLARPIGMQDFDRSRHKKGGDLTKSVYPDYHMHFSTRDMARLGYLMLREGDWNGKQLVPRDWTRRISSLVTPLYNINPPRTRGYASANLWGYGYMWWVWDDHQGSGPFQGAYSAFGAIGQFITVFPALDTVVVHKTVPRAITPTRSARVDQTQYQAVLMHVVTSYCGSTCN